MFIKSSTYKDDDFFSSFDLNLDENRKKILNNNNQWWNVFYNHVTVNIDETIFSDLYCDGLGRPNASVRLLVSMMVLKEGFGWSDLQLFEQCRFNLTAMTALGLNNLCDRIPSESKYYEFKKAIFEHQINKGEDLFEKVCNQVTKDQAELFGVSGEKIRMDSKLIGSNIANCCRFQLIHGCIQVFWKSLNLEQKTMISKEDQDLLNELMEKNPQKQAYRLSNIEKKERLLKMGELLTTLCDTYQYSDTDKYELIERILFEQYTVEQNQVILKDGKEISADSLQSPHDSDCTYRKKREQSVKGYNTNVVETCNDEGLNLIIDTKVESASEPDNNFVQSGIEKGEEIVGEIKESWMDGAYNDESNTEYAKKTEKVFHFTGIQGAKGRFTFEETDEGIIVTDLKTQQTQKAEEYKPGKFKIRDHEKNRNYYFEQKTIDTYLKRKQIENEPDSIKYRRNNVEATIFQLCCFTRNNKLRYRGKIKTQTWAFCRSMWINIVRICKHERQLCPITV